ncbi:MAG: hypothetical protein ABS62_09215 [Microbacterium sp. SCN 70-200]|uniref:hypothetical protein n=1 Tax=unclassified Microbacterium TaxID=2609290 RepID=UPI00086DE587|nr:MULTISPECIES: hypothetical protein [unclassified Microbacterium]MBN9214485.1 hypothetical protein [Microbacterium sp.]ODT40729.1 MAG: hypothetical protein ABS62_09215 [Microbacterium sp. SCN 70-200]OJV83726.1 MAG: hypothetical protein BGO46_11960 [Microbacterium sp. 70-16]
MLRTQWGRVRALYTRTLEDDRGDVPGWVLVTLMTAGLVVAIWALAGPALADLFEQALARVAGF